MLKICLTVFLVLGSVSVSRAQKPMVPEAKADSAKAVELILAQTNDFRREQKREPVKINAKLSETALEFAKFMAKTGKYGHEADGSKPADRATKHGYDYCLIEENIAYQFSSEDFTTEDLAKRFVEGWEKSPGHRKNMLEPDVTETGAAVARSEETGYYYAVQMFGRPKSLAIAFKISNKSDAAVPYKVDEQAFTIEPNYIRIHTVCRPTTVTVDLPGGATETIKPKTGEEFVIDKQDKSYRIRKQK